MSGINGSGPLARTAAAVAFALTVIPVPSFSAEAPELSEKPQRAASATQFEAQTSTIAPSIDVTYRALGEAANAAADVFAGPHAGRTRIGCRNVGFGGSAAIKITLFSGCADFDWHINAQRDGSITVKRAGEGIEIDVPVKFTGDGSFIGDLAKTIETPRKNFNGTFVVSISGMVRVDKDFCPRVEQPQSHFAWGTAPDIELVGRTCLESGHNLKACIGPWELPAGKLMTDTINRALQGQVDAINRKIPCDDIRRQLQQVWKTWSMPVPIANPPIFVELRPKALSVPGVIATDDGIRLIARLDATTAVSTTRPVEPQPGSLPENDPITSPTGRFSLAVPLPIPYPALATVGEQRLVGKPIRAGGAAITPTGVEIFPSNDHLAVGVTIRADVHGPMHGKSGTVWFTATPAIDNNGQAVRLNDLAMTQKRDDRLWSIVSRPVNSGLAKAINTSFAYDFSGLVRDTRTKLDQAIADPKNTVGVKITIANDDLHLGRTAMLPDNLVVEGLFIADVTATLQGSVAQSR